MPIQPTPPLPPATPAQQQMIDQFKALNNNNGYSPSVVDESQANSVSESENTVNQSGSLLNIQNNNNYDTFFRYSGGTHIPAPTVNINASVLPGGETVVTGGINIPIGGRASKLATREVELATISKEASVCTGIIKAGINVDGVDNLAFCKGYAPTIDKMPKKTQLADLKRLIREQQAALKDQQDNIKALNLRLIQMNHQPKFVPATH